MCCILQPPRIKDEHLQLLSKIEKLTLLGIKTLLEVEALESLTRVPEVYESNPQ